MERSRLEWIHRSGWGRAGYKGSQLTEDNAEDPCAGGGNSPRVQGSFVVRTSGAPRRERQHRSGAQVHRIQIVKPHLASQPWCEYGIRVETSTWDICAGIRVIEKYVDARAGRDDRAASVHEVTHRHPHFHAEANAQCAKNFSGER